MESSGRIRDRDQVSRQEEGPWGRPGSWHSPKAALRLGHAAPSSLGRLQALLRIGQVLEQVVCLVAPAGIGILLQLLLNFRLRTLRR